MISILTATENDMDRIIDIERGAISPPWTHGALLGEVYSDDSFFAVASYRDEASTGNNAGQNDARAIMGFVILRRVADEGELFQIAVDGAYRRRGAADALLSAALDWAKKNALCAAYLEVRKSNEAAIALYKKHGFKQAGLRKNYFTEPVEDAIVMAKSF